MSRSSPPSGTAKGPTRTTVTVFALSFLALVVAGVSVNFRAQLDPGSSGGSGDSSSSSSEAPYRECSSRGTMFQGMRNLDRVQQLFVETMSDVAEERQEILTDSSLWKCDETEPSMPELTRLAESMPGWYYRRSNLFATLFGFGYTSVLRPVTFEAFPTIIGEFLREYECTVSELQGETHTVVATNEDYPPGTEFCCTMHGCGAVRGSPDLCTGAISEDPQCNRECSLARLTQVDISTRAPQFSARALPERTRARIAVERTLSVFRSYETEYETIRQLLCTERATLDLLNSTALLSEAASCMPKIWDAATSLHDKK